MKPRTNIFLTMSVLVISFVSAQIYGGSIENGSFGAAQLIVSILGPFFSALLGGGTELLFERVLIFLIITSIVYMTVRNMSIFQGNSAIVFIVTFSVSLLAVRFTQITELVYTVLIPYQALGVAMSAFLPLLVGFFFIHNAAENSAFLRKSFWIFLIVVFFAMWDIYAAAAGPLSWMYFWSALLAFLFFLFDGTIRRAMVNSQMQQAKVDSAETMSIRIRDELERLEKSHSAGHVTDKVYHKIKRRLNKQLENLLKY